MNEKNKTKTIFPFFLISILFIILDQLSKYMIYQYFGISHIGFGDNAYYTRNVLSDINIIGDILKFTYVENAGIAFGIGFGPFKIILSIFSVVAGILLSIYLYKLKNFHWGIKSGVSMILAGAVGNLIDRVFYGLIFGYADLFYGKVIDFILVDIPDIEFLNLRYWPVFNIADSCVTVGVFFLLIFYKQIPSMKDLLQKKIEKTNLTDISKVTD
ncbi:MAG: signal peptidase II [Candidatus Pacearchaeota archaeon]